MKTPRKRQFSRGERREGDSNPRYGFDPVHRFSKPAHSATLPSLRVGRDSVRNQLSGFKPTRTLLISQRLGDGQQEQEPQMRAVGQRVL